MNLRDSSCSFALVLLVACGSGDELALSGGGDTAGAGESTTGNASGTATADSSADSRASGTDSAGSEEDAGSSSGDPNGADGDTGPASPEDFSECEGIACGNGTCILGEDGPACLCDPGYAAAGLQCIPCEPAAAPWPLEIGRIDIELDVTLGGADFPASEYEDGNIVLRGRGTGDEILVGSTHDPVLVATVVPGDYDVFYEHESGTSVPMNRRARVAVISVEAGGEPIGIEIPIERIEGTFEIDGEAPSASPYQSGRVWLKDPLTGDSVLLGTTDTGSFSLNVIPGEYDVRYEHFAGDEMPQNQDAWVGHASVEDGGGEVVQVLPVVIRTTTVAGNFTVAGQIPSASPYESGRIVALDRYSGESIELGLTHDRAFSIRLVQGEYDIVYERVAGGEQVPANKHALLSTQSLFADGALDIDVPAVTVYGSFRFDGAPAPPDNADDAVITLRDAAGTDMVVLGNTHDGVYEKLVIPGVYDVYYHHESAGAAVPLNTHALVAAAPVMQDMTLLEIEVPTIDVAGAITINGAVPPDSEYEDGRIYLRNLETGDSVLLGSTRDGAFAGKVIPAVYDVVYVVEAAGGAAVPVNSAAVLATVDVGTTPQFDVDVPSIPFSGSFTIDGGTPPANPADNAFVLLEDARTGDVVYLGNTNAGAYAQPIASGTYVVYYRAMATSGLVPENTNFGVSCIVISAP
jgi:hypothetical protein